LYLSKSCEQIYIVVFNCKIKQFIYKYEINLNYQYDIKNKIHKTSFYLTNFHYKMFRFFL